jgi:N-acetylglucosaminyldiphosphoundecaprenol N-acetyl-beta-D-mannosaminyltransferase
MRKLLVILGIPIDDLTMAEALDRLEEFVVIGRESGKSHQVATVNADFVVKAQYDPELRYLLQESDLATADGMPLVWGARLLGVPLVERVAGADMIPALARRAAQEGYSLYFLGAAPGVASKAGKILQEENPRLKIVGIASPPYSSVLEMDRTVVEDIKKAKPDILLVAFGNPKQEKWIGMYGRELGVPVMIGVGGTLDFIAGTTKRAPMWMQRLGLEWLFRLLHDPRRLWRRYVVDMVVFGSFFVRQWWVMRQGHQPPILLPRADVVIVEDTAVLAVQGRLDISNLAPLVESAERALRRTPYLLVDLSKATFLDSAAIGALVGLTKQARDSGGKMWLVSVPESIFQTLSLMRLDRFFEFHEDVSTGLTARRARNLSSTRPAQEYGEWTVVKMPRRMDAATCPKITRECSNMLNRNPYLVLDLSETVFLASAGLATFVQLNREAREEGGELRLTSGSEEVRSVLRIARFDQVFTLYNDVFAATA